MFWSTQRGKCIEGITKSAKASNHIWGKKCKKEISEWMLKLLGLEEEGKYLEQGKI